MALYRYLVQFGVFDNKALYCMSDTMSRVKISAG